MWELVSKLSPKKPHVAMAYSQHIRRQSHRVSASKGVDEARHPRRNGQLVRKAEDTSQQLASRLRSTGGKPEEAAKGSNSPSSPIGDLILAARNSFQAIVEDAADQAEPGSSSDDSSRDGRKGGDGGVEVTMAPAPPSRHEAAVKRQGGFFTRAWQSPLALGSIKAARATRFDS